MGKAGKSLILVIAIGGAVFFGYQYYRDQRCKGFEEDYLNAFAEIRQAVQLDQFSADIPRLGSHLQQQRQEAEEEALQALVALSRECGKRAADTAQRKALTGL